MNEDKKAQLLKESATFCMAPWTHLHIFPDARVFPCCWASSSSTQELGSLKDRTLPEIWNSEKLRNLRVNMLAGNKTPSICSRCYNLEAAGVSSLRKKMNGELAHHWNLVEATQRDGFVQKVNLPYWDVRFSNLCNMKCRSCGPTLSSSWGQELGLAAHQSVIRLSVEAPGVMPNLMDHIEDLEEIYFAGGEPLIMDEHYQILERLISLGKTNVRLRYNTNFSMLNYRKGSVLALWKHFPQIHLGASLDGMEREAEYIRYGTRWGLIEENRRLLLEQCPHVFFNIESTISILNSLHIFDFVVSWAKKGLIGPHQYFANLLEGPKELNIQNLPDSLKSKVKDRALDFTREMQVLFPEKSNPGHQFADTIVNFMEARSKWVENSNIIQFLENFDLKRNQDWKITFPTLKQGLLSSSLNET
jgi:radical SAM protein with 4Fe4S-binding SPASM domain